MVTISFQILWFINFCHTCSWRIIVRAILTVKKNKLNRVNDWTPTQFITYLINRFFKGYHYADVIMTKMASQITSLTVVYSTVYSDADQIKHQSSASLAFVWGIHRDRWIPRTKGQLRGKCFHLVTSSWDTFYRCCIICIDMMIWKG